MGNTAQRVTSASRSLWPKPYTLNSSSHPRCCAARYHVHRAALAALLAVGAVLAMDATNAFFIAWLLCAPWRSSS